ncbi:Gfo/Idh/MocA family protein [Niabella ginsengisoli]|uniref:Gfo/Idh/MocA family oxidoreductase n=1 Tax=Niabella ginsengisoli TaxID=522298 RepID=A0ABS9SGR5_9BACT|nr:Gfo/Idh/MocA family oxidoreductase [Niabella ginsengisoli]MCH5597540.1 Gfo/Idh/MocA family oxidoreductase [Niabella ginsengisoli]
MEKNFIARIVLIVVLIFTVGFAYSQKLNVGVVGLSHDHAHVIMNQYKSGEVNIIAIAEPDNGLKERYKKAYNLPESIFYSSINEMLAHTKPDAVLAYNAISDHLAVVEACAPKGISVMVEKPLATTVEQAEKMKVLKDKHKIQILVNYETTWYPSNQQIYSLVNSGTVGEVRKMIVHDGHQGPVEIGCSKDFLAWLTDPVKNGGGAITDFGCYGANIMTWLMKGEAPVAVSAITHQIKPEIYPNVDDDATILLEYPNATGIIEASWNWPFSIKDWEVFGVKGYLHAKDAQTLEHRDNKVSEKLSLQPVIYKDNLAYLSAALKGEIKDENDLSSFNVNMIVVKILAAAKESAKTGKKVKL